jgi:ABC-type branched-subunit amino acid transport system ATPase component
VPVVYCAAVPISSLLALLLDEIAGGLTEPECLALVETIQDIRRRVNVFI